MTPDEFRALIAQHGGTAGAPTILDDPKDEEIAGVKTGDKLPNPSPRLKFTMRDGTHIVVRQQDSGQYDVVDGGTAMKDTAGTTAAQAETARHNRAQEAQSAQTASRQASAESRQATAAQIQANLQAQKFEWDKQVQAGQMTREDRDSALKNAIAQANNDIAKARLAVEQQAEVRQGQEATATNAYRGRTASLGEAQYAQDAGKAAIDRARMGRSDAGRKAFYNAAAKNNGMYGPVAAGFNAMPDLDYDQIAHAAADHALGQLKGLATQTPAPADAPPAAGAGAPTQAAQNLAPPPPPTPQQMGLSVGRFGQ